jgi:hypothetical protein
MIREDKVLNGHVVSVVVTDADVQNGDIIEVGALRTDGEAYNATKAISNENGRIAVVCDPELGYADDMVDPDWTIKSGKMLRARIEERGNMFTTEQSRLAGISEVGKIANVDATTGKLKIDHTSTGTALEVLVVAHERLAGKDVAVLEVL